ncbi:unnamed protein product [Amoebophrya sp. A25]|nr:unnamed protein product [Amoebophrya sp. A25]|eukprot:GSA25T00014711001.1
MSSSGSLSTANETSRAQQEQMKIPHAPLLAGGGSSCSTSASAASPAAASSKACALGERNTSGGASCVVSETARCKNLSVRKSLYYVSGVAVLRNALSLVYRLLKIIARRGVLPASRLVIHVLEAAFPDDGAALEDDKHSDDASFHDSREYDEDE